MSRTLMIVSAIFANLLFTACEDQQEADLFKAQICIDKASASSVNGCLDLIEGDNSERAYVLRCSAAFISEGIDETAIVNAVENIDGSGGGDPTTPAIAALAMSTTAISAAAVSTCNATNSDALIALANFANIATAMDVLLSFPNNPTSAQIDALIDSYNPGTANAADKAALGTAVIAGQSSLCDPNSGLFQGNEACADIDAAVAANPNDPSAVADALIANLNTPSS